MDILHFLTVAEDLELAGLLWKPEIGDEIAERTHLRTVSVLVDPQGMTPAQLRSIYLWLPTVEQMVLQLEARQVILCHTGLELSEKSIGYRTVVQAPQGQFETIGSSLRLSVGMALRSILLCDNPETIQ